VTGEELAVGLRALPHFKTLSDEDVRLLVDLIDFDKSGEISLQVRAVYMYVCMYVCVVMELRHGWAGVHGLHHRKERTPAESRE
jgi:hypothetical protein